MRFIASLIFFAVSGALLAPLPSAAQSAVEEREVSERFARCIIEKLPDTIESALAENWDPTRYMLDLPHSKRDDCLDRKQSLPVNTPDLRSSLAIAMFDKKGLDAVPTDFSAVPQLSQDTVWSSTPVLRRVAPGQTIDREAEKAKADARKVMLRTGECVVRSEPQAVRALLANRKNRTLLNPVIPALQACAPAGTQLAFTADDLIANLALNYVRLYLTATAQSGSKPNA